MTVFVDMMTRSSGRCDTASTTVSVLGDRRFTTDWEEAQRLLRERLQAHEVNELPALRRGKNLTWLEWADFYLVDCPQRAKTRQANQRASKHWRGMFDRTRLANLTVDDIEQCLRRRLEKRVHVRTSHGEFEKGP